MSVPVDHRKDLADKATQWLTEELYPFTEVGGANVILNVVIQIADFNINIVVEENRRDSLAIMSTLGLPETLRKAFKYLTPELVTRFLFDVEMALHTTNVQYSFMPNAANLEKIGLTKVLYYDGLTKEKFFDTILMVAKTLNILNLHFARLRA